MTQFFDFPEPHQMLHMHTWLDQLPLTQRGRLPYEFSTGANKKYRKRRIRFVRRQDAVIYRLTFSV